MWAAGKWITDNILKVLGSAGDTGGSATAGTAMAKANKVLDYLANGTYGLSAIANGGVKVIKSVQRGVHAGGDTNANINISISPVSPEKCHVTIQQEIQAEYQSGAATGSARTEYRYSPRVVSLTQTILTVTRSTRAWSTVIQALPFSWEIVEYY